MFSIFVCCISNPILVVLFKFRSLKIYMSAWNNAYKFIDFQAILDIVFMIANSH
jgi:hypothetical protein